MNIPGNITDHFFKSTHVLPAPLLTQEMAISKIGQIGAQEIEDLSSALADLVIVNLGNYASARYTRRSDNFNQEIDIHTINSWEQDYLSCNSNHNFMNILKSQFIAVVTEALTRPDALLEHGLIIVLSQEEAVGPLLNAMNEARMMRFNNDVPKHYEIELKVCGVNQSNQLFFELTQRIDGYQFYSVSFKF